MFRLYETTIISFTFQKYVQKIKKKKKKKKKEFLELYLYIQTVKTEA
jgi:hypothetical protein